MKQFYVVHDETYLGSEASMEDVLSYVNFACDWARENGYEPLIVLNPEYESWLHRDPEHREMVDRCWEAYIRHLHRTSEAIRWEEYLEEIHG